MSLISFLNDLFKEDGFELVDSNSKKYVIGNPKKEKPIVIKLLDQKLMQKLLLLKIAHVHCSVLLLKIAQLSVVLVLQCVFMISINLMVPLPLLLVPWDTHPAYPLVHQMLYLRMLLLTLIQIAINTFEKYFFMFMGPPRGLGGRRPRGKES